MDNKEVKEKQSNVSSNLFALECLATTAGQLHESEKWKKTEDEETSHQLTSNSGGEMTEKISSNKVPVVQMAPMSSTETTSSLLPSMNMGNFYPPPFPPTPPNTIRPFTDFTFPPPFSHSPFRNFMDIPASGFGIKMEDMPWRPTLPPVIPSTRESNEKSSPALSSDTEKSAFDIVHKRNSVSPNSTSSFDTSMATFPTSDAASVLSNGSSIPQEPPQQPPLLFRLDQPPSNNSLLETLVQESQKILSGQDEEGSNTANEDGKSSKKQGSKKDAKQANKTNDDFKRAREMVLISPQKKSRKRSGLHSVSDVKRAYGGPPFKPGYTPPAINTAESATCCFYEHTLLKMATRGFWSGDRGPLQDVFRLSRVENSDLQYDMKAVTKHCYNVVKQKLENANGDKPMMYKHMRNYVDELDSYLERIYPVSSMAINLYLPTASDYSIATWHGIVPTGWSEYRRAVVIREVFEILYNISSTESETIPEYKTYFFCKPDTDKELFPLPFETAKKKTSDGEQSTEENLDSEAKDQNNNGTSETNNNERREFDLVDVKYSRAFEALWRRVAPHEPYVILADETKTSLREYFEKFPIEVHAPSDETLIVVDDKKYKARNILGFFRRGVQLVDYSKDTGSMVIDTISTIRNVSATSAVRKIPPGRISKLVHPELHLENYTNTITQVGLTNADGSPTEVPVKAKIRRRRTIKHRNSDGVNGKEEKVKKRRTKHTNSQSFDNDFKHVSPFASTDPFLTPTPPVVEKLASIESICNAMKIEGGGNPLKIEGVDDKQFPNMLTPSAITASSLPSISSHYPVFTPPPIQRVSSAESPKCLSEIRTPQRSESGGSGGSYSVESFLPKENDKISNESRDPRESMLDMHKLTMTNANDYRVNQYTQTIYDTPPQSKNDALLTPNLFSPDILSPFTSHLQQHPSNVQSPLNLPPCPPGPPDQQMFSLHLMIDSYRRAAKYLLDTANHLELVARHGNHVNNNTPSNKKQPPHSDVTKKEDD